MYKKKEISEESFGALFSMMELFGCKAKDPINKSKDPFGINWDFVIYNKSEKELMRVKMGQNDGLWTICYESEVE